MWQRRPSRATQKTWTDMHNRLVHCCRDGAGGRPRGRQAPEGAAPRPRVHRPRAPAGARSPVSRRCRRPGRDVEARARAMARSIGPDMLDVMARSGCRGRHADAWTRSRWSRAAMRAAADQLSFAYDQDRGRDREAERRDREAERRQREREREARRGTRRGYDADDRVAMGSRARSTSIASSSSRARKLDAALYWKAYAQNRLGQRAEALTTIAELSKSHPDEPLPQAGPALEVEVRRDVGQPVRPQDQTDEDLKLMALQALQNSAPEQAIPMLQKVLDGHRVAAAEGARAVRARAEQLAARRARSCATSPRAARRPSSRARPSSTSASTAGPRAARVSPRSTPRRPTSTSSGGSSARSWSPARRIAC